MPDAEVRERFAQMRNRLKILTDEEIFQKILKDDVATTTVKDVTFGITFDLFSVRC